MRLFQTIFMYCLVVISLYKIGQCNDPGVPDTIIVGNLDYSAIQVNPGDTVDIPVWVKNDEDVACIVIPAATDTQFVSARLGGNIFYPLTEWDNAGFGGVYEDQPFPGLISQSLLGWHDISPPFNSPFLNTNGDYLKIAEYRILISPNLANIGSTSQLIEGYDVPQHSGTMFGGDGGINSWGPVFMSGAIYITGDSSGCNYVIGDVNGSDNYNGLDVTYGVSFFKGGPVPMCDPCALCPDFSYCGDVNSSCSYNGLDITYGVNFLKGGAGPEPCYDCPPGGTVVTSLESERVAKPAVVNKLKEEKTRFGK